MASPEHTRVPIQVLFISVLVSLATLLFGGGAFLAYRSESRARREGLWREVATSTDQLATSLILPVWYLDQQQIAQILDHLMENPLVQEVSVEIEVGGLGAITRVRGPGGSGHRVSSPRIAPGPDPSLIWSERVISLSGRTLGRVHLAYTTRLMEAALRSFLRQSLWALAGLDLLLVTSLSLLLWRVVLRPLREIQRLAGLVSSGSDVDLLLSSATYYGQFASVHQSLLRTFDLLQKDIADRRRSEEALHRLNRELRAVSECNQVLVHPEDEQSLLDKICWIICEEAGYRMAWVGYAENDEGKAIRPVAWAGVEDGYLANLKLSWADDLERGQGPASRAIRCGETACIQDFAIDLQVAPWRESALQRGYRSGIALPLKGERGEVFGLLLIYSAEVNAFTPEEIRLLEELSADLAFGITALRVRTEQRQMEAEMRRRAIYQRTLLDTIPYFVWLKDEKSCLLAANLEMARVARVGSTADLEGKTDFDFFPPDLAEKYVTDDRSIMESRQQKNIEEMYADEHGERHWMETWKSPVIVDGRVVGTAGCSRDITERKQAENEILRLNAELEQRVESRTAELEEIQRALIKMVDDLSGKTLELEQANAKLKELDRLKAIFIASMSHELRTPLNSIIGFSSILHNEWNGPLNSEQKENLGIILRCGKHLLNLINDVIDVSKIETGGIESVPQAFDLQDLIGEAVALLGKELDDKGLELRIEVPRQQMHTDRQRLMQCLLNLLSNAMKYTEQGSVTVEARFMECPDGRPEARFAEINVTDTGIGIRKEDLPRMFQPFVRLNSPLQQTVSGTGLGLYLTRKLASDVLKGDVMLVSEFGRGSQFTLRIPVRAP